MLHRRLIAAIARSALVARAPSIARPAPRALVGRLSLARLVPIRPPTPLAARCGPPTQPPHSIGAFEHADDEHIPPRSVFPLWQKRASVIMNGLLCVPYPRREVVALPPTQRGLTTPHANDWKTLSHSLGMTSPRPVPTTTTAPTRAQGDRLRENNIRRMRQRTIPLDLYTSIVVSPCAERSAHRELPRGLLVRGSEKKREARPVAQRPTFCPAGGLYAQRDEARPSETSE